MQFSVIVEGPMESNAADEDALLELERFLRSSDIPPAALKQLKKGQPQVLKNELTYEQAVAISDKLMDLGLDSVIDPPIKPDEDDDIDEKHPGNVTPIKQNAAPRRSNSGVKIRGTTQSATTQSRQPQSQHTQSRHAGTATQRLNRKPALAVVKPVKQTKTPARPVPKMATVENKPPLTNTKPTSSKPVPQKPVVANTVKAAGKKTDRPTAKPMARPQPANQTVNKTNSQGSELAKAAADVKSLFQLPKEGVLKLPLPVTTRIKMLAGAGVCVLVPAVYATIWFALLYLSISLAAALYTVAGIILAPLPILLFIGVFALTHLPYFFARNSSSPVLQLRAKDEPRLFMLASAIGKVLNTPAPTTICLNDSTQLQAHQHCSLKEFFKFNEPLNGEIKISIGVVLIQCLSIRDLCSLVAKELGVYAYPELRRCRWVAQAVMTSVRFGAVPHPQLQQRLRTLHEQTSISLVKSILSTVSSLSERCHTISCSYFARGESLLKACLGTTKAMGARYQEAFLGSDTGRNEVLETLIHIDANHELAREEMLQNNKGRYISNLMDYSEYLLQKNRGQQSSEKSESNVGIVTSPVAMQKLIGHLTQYGQSLTRQTYQQAGLDTDRIELCSLQSLFQHEAKDQKFTQAAAEYFMDWLHPLQFWRLPAENLLPNGDKETIITRLNNCIARIRYVAPDRQSWLHRYDKVLKQLAELKAAKKIIASGNKFEFQRCAESARSLEQDLNQRKAQVKEAQVELRQHNAIMGERLALGLMLNQQQKELSIKLYQALSTCHGIADKAIAIINTIEELNHILRHKPKNQAQQFQLYVRELAGQISETEKAIRKRLMHCPYDVIDRRYPTMAQFVSSQQSEQDSLNLSHEQIIINKAKDTLAAVNWAYKQLNQRAAFIATAMEKQFGVETVKKIDKSIT